MVDFCPKVTPEQPFSKQQGHFNSPEGHLCQPEGHLEGSGPIRGTLEEPMCLMWHLGKNKALICPCRAHTVWIKCVTPTAQNTQSITADLHCDVIAGRWHALQHLIVAAAGAARQHHAGRDEDVLDLFRILLQNLHQQLPRLTQTLVVHLH